MREKMRLEMVSICQEHAGVLIEIKLIIIITTTINTEEKMKIYNLKDTVQYHLKYLDLTGHRGVIEFELCVKSGF